MMAPARPSLLFLTQRIPYPPNKGEKIPAYNFLRHLCERYDVHLGAFIDDEADQPGIAELARMTASQCIVPIDPRWHWPATALRWALGSPVSYAKFRSRRLASWVQDTVRRTRPEVIFAQSSNIGCYATDCLGTGEKPVTILHFVDVDSAKFAAYAAQAQGPMRWIMAIEDARVRAEEARLARLADAVTLISQDEAALFQTIHGGVARRLEVLPNGVDTLSFQPEPDAANPLTGAGPHYVFTGAMDYAPNSQAVCWFAAEVLPALRIALPEAQFWIVGSNPAREVQALARLPGVTVTGRVDRVQPYLQHATACVAPLRIARGVQNKVLEAMAMARPVIASVEALTGIGDPDTAPVRVAATPAEWVAACRWAAGDARAAQSLGDAARADVIARFSWQAQFDRLDALIAAGKPA